ncbi:MAG: CRISPR-associated protein Cas4 [Bacteroides sp.]|nr:CRISPR-associated protein Cas4 [Bacteroides sp.]MCM1084846.1 CRISPR-associated protein Cas4 [Bacteroides sp.]
MHITGTHFQYYHVCKRKLWLFSNGIMMEHTSDLVFEGRLIHEESYPQRSARYEEIAIDGIKVDFYDPREKVIHEIKKSNKIEVAHEWQLKYYLYVFERNGLLNHSGIIEYPTLRRTKTVVLTDEDRNRISVIEKEIEAVAQSETCPAKEKRSRCVNCSYFDFCYSEEVEEP